MRARLAWIGPARAHRPSGQAWEDAGDSARSRGRGAQLGGVGGSGGVGGAGAGTGAPAGGGTFGP